MTNPSELYELLTDKQKAAVARKALTTVTEEWLREHAAEVIARVTADEVCREAQKLIRDGWDAGEYQSSTIRSLLRSQLREEAEALLHRSKIEITLTLPDNKQEDSSD